MIWEFLRNQTRNHQTILCPHCGKDSWQSLFELPAKCMWCKKLITIKQGLGEDSGK
jgi:phage FluMu protein Com